MILQFCVTGRLSNAAQINSLNANLVSVYILGIGQISRGHSSFENLSTERPEAPDDIATHAKRFRRKNNLKPKMNKQLLMGLEPMTSSLPRTRSTTELQKH